jgi:hypothetical protein
MQIEPTGPPTHWPPLGLPTGSIRAILTLIVVGVVTHAIVTEQQLDVLWTETLLIALAHYFTSRRFVALSPDVIKRLQAEGVLDRESNPLFLPRNSIRIILVAIFAGLAWWLYHEGRLFKSHELTVLLIVAAYVLGAMVRGVSGWLSSKTGHRPSSRWGDMRALMVLGAVVFAALTEVLPTLSDVPPIVDRVGLSLLLFYFGSR